MIRSLLALFAFALSLPAAAQIVLAPAAPRVHDTVVIQLDGRVIGEEWTAQTGPEVTMAGNTVTVTLPLTGANGLPANLEWELGAFPAGNYQVQVVKRSTGGAVTTLAQAGFAVAPRNGNVPRTNYSDLWFNPQESGWGLNIQQHPSDKIFATWFVYGLDNRPMWYVIPDGQWTSDHEYTGTIYRTRGPFFEDTVFDPGLVSVIPAGTGKLTFNKYNAAVFTYTIDGVNGQKAVVRQGF
jgi:hypothetical protein